LLLACPGTTPGVDAGPGIDAGIDAGTSKPDGGKSDAGHKPDAGPVDAGFVDVPVSAWCQDYGLALCTRDVRCLRLNASNLAECIANKSQYCDQTAYSRAVAEGRLQYLAPKAAECLNAFASKSCEEVPAACAQVFTGEVAPDAGCILTEECNSTLGFCYQYDSVCPHHCRGWLGLGQTCDGFTTRCKPDDAYCGPNDAGTGNICQPLKGMGADCVEYDSCRAELACATGKCVRRQAAEGESCGELSGFPYCHDEFFCRQDNSTSTPPPGSCQARGGLGAVCSGYGSCLPSLRCKSNFTTATCVARAAEGEPCSNYGDCEETLYCPPHTSRCAKIPGDGGDCTSMGSYFECASAHFCDFNSPDGIYTCRPRHALGETCTYDGVCLSNDCEYGVLTDGGFGGTCVPSCSQKADGGF
jgi:hypothetical protein